MQDTASFWTDIKELEEQLAKMPDSYCFARLSDVYLKVGLIDDAIHVARQGVTKHPRYMSGQRALSHACIAKELNGEALPALQMVTEALPEDVQSQKLLGRLYAEAGNPGAAIQAFSTALEFAPDDVECRLELESLVRASRPVEPEPDEADEEIIEDLEILEEIDAIEEDQSESEVLNQAAPSAPVLTSASHQDPLSTGTLAELYVTQGFVHKALGIYRAILADNPSDRITAERIIELEKQAAGPPEPEFETDDICDIEAENEPAFSMPQQDLHKEIRQETTLESDGYVVDNQQSRENVSWSESGVPVVSPRGITDKVLSTLDGWLENIRRIKSCR